VTKIEGFLGRFFAALGRLFAPRRKRAAHPELRAGIRPRFWSFLRLRKRRLILYDRKPLGPAFEMPDPERLRIVQGPLSGWEFKMITEVSDDEAHVRLFREGREVGHCDLQRNAFEATVVLWNIVVQEDLRHKGLASVMAFTAFRKMLELYTSASFGIRMIRLIKPKETVTRVQNVGIGVIARKLGFSPAYSLEKILRRDNIQLVQLVSADADMPPAYRIVLKTFPLVLVAFVVDQDTAKPFDRQHPIYSHEVKPEMVESWVACRSIIIGNGNYLLREDGIEAMINHLATSELEADIYNTRIRRAS
jgi:hypothetical protein